MKFGWGPLISIIGPEGAGKSTTVENLHKYLRQKGIKVSFLFFGRGNKNIIPINKLNKMFKKEKREKYTTIKTNVNDEKIEEIRKEKISLKKRGVHTCASFILTADMMLRYLVHIIPKRIQNQIVITDRYVSDLYNMENVPKGIRSFLVRLFPIPTITFYIYNTIEVMHERKKRNISDLEWQVQNFAVLNKRFGSFSIKTENKEEAINQIITVINEKLNCKY